MKILGFEFGAQKPEIQMTTVDTPYQSFSTPFADIGPADLTKPYISSYYKGPYNTIKFGQDNLYPQLISQLRWTSPLNGAIIKFKINTVIGGGYEINPVSESISSKVDMYAFQNKIKLPKLIKKITKDFIVHERCEFLVTVKSGIIIKIERVDPARTRYDKYKTIAAISEDWSRSIDVKSYSAYHPGCSDGIYWLHYDEEDDYDYPLPHYMSAANSMALDGESSYLHKQNILNSIFPSFALMFPSLAKSDSEKRDIISTVERAKGSKNAGKVMIFQAAGLDKLPKVETIPTNQNDKLFESTDKRIDEQICRAHTIAPIIIGIQTPGKLGSGQELTETYTIFEKNFVMPTRNTIQEIVEELFAIGGIPVNCVINNFQIIDNEIKDKTPQK